MRKIRQIRQMRHMRHKILCKCRTFEGKCLQSRHCRHCQSPVISSRKIRDRRRVIGRGGVFLERLRLYRIRRGRGSVVWLSSLSDWICRTKNIAAIWDRPAAAILAEQRSAVSDQLSAVEKLILGRTALSGGDQFTPPQPSPHAGRESIPTRFRFEKMMGLGAKIHLHRLVWRYLILTVCSG